MARNLITDVEGVLVGSADDTRLASGVTVVLFEEPAIASIAMNGGAPALRDTVSGITNSRTIIRAVSANSTS